MTIDQTGFVPTPHVFSTIRSLRGPVPLDLTGGPLERYGFIYLDPPWDFDNYSELGEDRNPNRHYDTMPIEDIMALPVGDLAAEDCMMGMWATFPRLPEALMALSAWGFRYVTVGQVWIKLNKSVGLRRIIDLARDIFMSTGYWTRSNAEIVILASRGSPQRASKSIRQVVHAPRGIHSEKPLVFRENMQNLVHATRRIELFCRREPTADWDVWGNQVGAIEAGTIAKRKIVRLDAPLPLFDDGARAAA